MTNTTVTAEHLIRNQMSAMAWVMAALCAWVVILSAHTVDCQIKQPTYSAPIDADTVRLPTAARQP